MPSLTHILNNGKSSLIAHQRAIANTANNASNVSTPGFHRRDSNFSPKAFEGGVNLEMSRRQAANYITEQILDQNAALGGAQAKSASLASVDRLFREGEGSMGNAIDRFFNAVRNLALAPADVDRRQEALSKADEMAQTIAGTAKRLEQERRAVDQSLDTLVEKVNSLASELAQLNKDITLTPGEDAQNAALLDRQALVLKELGELVPVHSFRDKQGHLTVLLGGAQALVQADEHASLAATPDLALDGLKSLKFVGISGLEVNVTDKIHSGQIGGILGLRDSTLTAMVERVDALAFDLSSQINAVHETGFGLDGSDGRPLFEAPPVGVTGAATAMAIHADMIDRPDRLAAAADASGAVGDNSRLLELQNLEDQPLAGAGARTFASEVADLIGVVGRTVQANQEQLSRAKIAKEAAENMEQSQVGVALDEEMIDLMRFQRAYQASSKLIKTVDELYETVLGLK